MLRINELIFSVPSSIENDSKAFENTYSFVLCNDLCDFLPGGGQIHLELIFPVWIGENFLLFKRREYFFKDTD